jgi:hypothetical protein
MNVKPPLIFTGHTRELTKYIRPQFSGKTKQKLIALTNNVNQQRPDEFVTPADVCRMLIDQAYANLE